MSGVTTTEAIVLRAIKFKESSKIVTFYTKESGKLAGIVKGARRAKNPFGSALEPMSHVSLVVYHKEGREVQTIAQCDHLKRYPRLADDLAKMAAGMSVIELAGMVAHEQERNPRMFDLIAGTLESLNRSAGNPSNYRWYFELKLLEIAGFRPFLDRCAICRVPVKEEEALVFHIVKGGLLCAACAADERLPVPTAVAERAAEFRNRGAGRHQAPPSTVVALAPGMIGPLKELAEASTPDGAEHIRTGKFQGAIGNLLTSYLKFHVSGIRPLKSDKIFSRILVSDATQKKLIAPRPPSTAQQSLKKRVHSKKPGFKTRSRTCPGNPFLLHFF